jgi:hypothetical protein
MNLVQLIEAFNITNHQRGSTLILTILFLNMEVSHIYTH